MKFNQKKSFIIIFSAIFSLILTISPIIGVIDLSKIPSEYLKTPKTSTEENFCKDYDFTLGSWSSSAGWSWDSEFYGVYGNLDPSYDYASYFSASKLAYLQIQDNALYSGEDEWERIWIYQTLPRKYFQNDDYWLHIDITYQFEVDPASCGLWPSEEKTEVYVQFGFEGNWQTFESYEVYGESHPGIDTGVTTWSTDIDCSSLVSYPYPTDFDIAIRMDAAQIAFETEARTYIYDVNVSADWSDDPPPTPNFECTDIVNNSALEEGQPANITATIKNVGNLDAGSTVATLYIDDKYQDEQPVPALTIGSQAEVEFENNPLVTLNSPGTHTVKVEVDPNDDILESNETNNIREEEWYWNAGPGTIIKEEIINFTYNFNYYNTFSADYSLFGIGSLDYDITFFTTFSLNMPVRVSIIGKEELRAGISDSYEIKLQKLEDQATWSFSVGGSFDVNYDVLGIYGNHYGNGEINLDGSFTTPLGRFVLPFDIINYPLLTIPSIVSLDLTITPVIATYITADLDVIGQGSASASELIWRSYENGYSKSVLIQPYADATDPNLDIFVDNFEYNVDLEFDWTLGLDFEVDEVSFLLDLLGIGTSVDLFTWPKINLLKLESEDTVNMTVDIKPIDIKEIDIFIEDRNGDPINQHENDWCTVVLYETVYDHYFNTFTGLVNDSTANMKVLNDRKYCWDVYIDGTIIGTGTIDNGNWFYVDDSVDNLTIQISRTYTPLNFSTIEFYIFNDSSTPWTPLATENMGTVLSLYNLYNNSIDTEWVVVGIDPAMSGKNNTFAFIDENGFAQVAYNTRPNGEYKVSITEFTGEFPWDSPRHWNDLYFKLNNSNSGKAIIHNNNSGTPTLDWDTEIPTLNSNDIVFDPQYLNCSDVYISGNSTIQIDPSDDIGIFKVWVEYKNKTINCVKDDSVWKSQLDLLTVDDGNYNLTVYAMDYAGNIVSANISSNIDNTEPEIHTFDYQDNGNTIDFSVEASDDIGISMVELIYTWDNVTWETLNLDFISGDLWQKTLNKDSHTGMPHYYLKVKDNVFNTKYIDTEAPSITILECSESSNQIYVEWSASDRESGMDFVAIYINDTYWGYSREDNITIPVIPKDDTQIKLIAFDKAGNNATDTEFVLFDDNYEPNNDLSSAYDISSYGNVWLSTLNGNGIQCDDDWYKIFVHSGFEHLIVKLIFSHSEGDIDLSVYDSSGFYVTSSRSITDNETIDYTVDLEGTYYLRVWYGNNGNSYDLWWEDYINNDDNYEPNDGKGDPYDISLYEQTWLYHINGYGLQCDDDWYKIYVDSGFEHLKVKVVFDDNAGNIGIWVFDDYGNFVVESTPYTDGEEIDYTLPNSGYYYLRIWGDNAENYYNLWWDDVSPSSSTSGGDEEIPSYPLIALISILIVTVIAVGIYFKKKSKLKLT
ncbi:MAG: hypothetical protein EU547_03990 [Promethearchaeota archaeon]|nr:MAG: hypothetical protein EU547_03990 [Candidatus Lokiarchaeota archaeon]